LFVPELQAEAPPAPTRWAIDAGYGVRIWDANGNPEQREYEEKAKRGWILSGDVAVFPFRHFGAGFSYYRFHSSTTDDDLGFGDGSRGPAMDEYLIEYVGPSLYFKRDFARVTALVQAGAGVLYYDNQHEAPDFPGVLQGVEPGFFGSVGADYKLSRHFAVGATARLIYGSLDRISYNGLDVSVPPVSLSRFDLSAGIRYYP
jgi:hypothetical protein